MIHLQMSSPSHVPFKSLGSSFSKKSTKRASPSTLPERAHVLPSPPTGYPGSPLVPDI